MYNCQIGSEDPARQFLKAYAAHGHAGLCANGRPLGLCTSPGFSHLAEGMPKMSGDVLYMTCEDFEEAMQSAVAALPKHELLPGPPIGYMESPAAG